MVFPSCAAGEGKGAAGYSITIIPRSLPPLSQGPKWGCMGMWGNSVEGTQLAASPAGFMCVRVCVCVCVCVCVTGLNLPVGDVIKAPHTAGSDGGTAAVEEGININQACIKETALQSQPDLHLNN